jgi:DNA-binding MarR family transcriptional regulator
MLRRLERGGLLRRERDPSDGRRALLQLTGRGVRLNERRAGTIEAVVAEVLARTSSQRIAASKAMLHAIAAALQAEPV